MCVLRVVQLFFQERVLVFVLTFTLNSAPHCFWHATPQREVVQNVFPGELKRKMGRGQKAKWYFIIKDPTCKQTNKPHKYNQIYLYIIF